MQPIEKKQRRSHRHLRVWLILLLFITLVIFVVLNLRSKPKTPVTVPDTVTTYGELITREQADVARLQITLQSGASWTLLQENGVASIEGQPSFPLDTAMVSSLLNAACVVSYSNTLSEDPSEYADRLDEFGLAHPRSIARITYTDGTSATVRVGDRCDNLDDAFYYMLVDGYDCLYALDVVTADSLCTDLSLMREVTQPVIHKARIDRFTIAKPDITMTWELDGSITDADAEDRWFLTEPVRYPAEGETMSGLRANLANLRVGTYIAEATAENLSAYGLDTPQMVLTIHMAAGLLGTVSEYGVYDTVDWPESEVVITVGNAKSDVVDYVLFDGAIYTTGHYSLDLFMSQTASATLTRYPVRTSLSNLKQLTVSTGGADTVYTVDRVEQSDDAGELLYDDNGQVMMDYFAYKNGETLDWDAFAAAYTKLLVSTVSGILPDGWQPTEDPHSVYTFQTVTGLTHTIALSPFDALHDAVIVDGCAMFYLVRDGLDYLP